MGSIPAGGRGAECSAVGAQLAGQGPEEVRVGEIASLHSRGHRNRTTWAMGWIGNKQKDAIGCKVNSDQLRARWGFFSSDWAPPRSSQGPVLSIKRVSSCDGSLKVRQRFTMCRKKGDGSSDCLAGGATTRCQNLPDTALRAGELSISQSFLGYRCKIRVEEDGQLFASASQESGARVFRHCAIKLARGRPYGQ